MTTKSREKHLIVLIHGLWGNHTHMSAILNELDAKLPSEMFTLYATKQSGKLRTFDGVEIIGYRTLEEIIAQIKTLAESGIKVTKISLVGYSLGGLVARFVAGKMHELGIFDSIEPQLFVTFATPHMGVDFYQYEDDSSVSRTVLNSVLRLMGSTFLGLSGRQLFIKDKSQMLVRLSEGEFAEGLQRFQNRVVFSNVKNDRTVAFYTSFMTQYNPLHQQSDLQFEFETNVPSYDINGHSYSPRIIDFQKVDLEILRKDKPKVTVKRKVFATILIFLLIVIWFPFVITINVLGTLYRYFHIWSWRRPSNDSFLTDFASNAVENALNLDNEDEDSTPVNDLQSSINWEAFISKYRNFEIRSNYQQLPLDTKRWKILENLRKIDFIKVPVYIRDINAHSGIVLRRGRDRKDPQKVASLKFATDLIAHMI